MKASTLLVVPMKEPHLAKSRLRDVLDRAERARLARQLFERTLRLITRMHNEEDRPDFDIAIVTRNASIKARAEALGVGLIDEQGNGGLSGAVEAAAAAAKSEGYKRFCVLPADLAAPDPKDVRVLLSQDLGEKGIALCPSRDFGTNALLVAPPDAIRFAYGHRSFQRHCQLAEAAGITPIVLPLESLRWDIDTSNDLEELMDVDPGMFDMGRSR